MSWVHVWLGNSLNPSEPEGKGDRREVTSHLARFFDSFPENLLLVTSGEGSAPIQHGSFVTFLSTQEILRQKKTSAVLN